MNIILSNNKYIVTLELQLFENKTLHNTTVEISIPIDKSTDTTLTVLNTFNTIGSKSLNVFNDITLNIDTIKKTINDNLPKIKLVASSILIAGSLLTSTANASDVNSVKNGTTQSQEFSQTQEAKILENKKIRTLLFNTMNDSIEEFKTLTTDTDVSKNNIFINFTNTEITNGYFKPFQGSIEEFKEKLTDTDINENIINKVNFDDDGMIMIFINKELLKLAVNEPDLYKEDVVKIVKNLFLHELTHKYGDKDLNFGEKAAGKNQIYKINQNSPIVKKIQGFIQTLEDKSEYNKDSFLKEIEIENNEFQQINETLSLNVKKIFEMDSEKISYIDGNREIGTSYIVENEYLENLIGDDSYKDNTKNRQSISSGYLYNINKSLLESGFSKKDIEKYNSDYLSKSKLVIETFSLDEEKLKPQEINDLLNVYLNKITEKAIQNVSLDKSIKSNLSL